MKWKRKIKIKNDEIAAFEGAKDKRALKGIQMLQMVVFCNWSKPI